MSIRKIKDAKDLSDSSLIYFKGHAKATYMSDGSTVEDTINNIKANGGGGGTIDLSDYETKTDAQLKLTEAKSYTDILILESYKGIYTQTLQLSSGFNWVSFFVDTTLNDLQESLGTKGLNIETSLDGGTTILKSVYDATTNTWSGNLNGIEKYLMYSILASEDCTILLTGRLLELDDTTIVLKPGTTYLGYPLTKAVSVTEFFSQVENNNGDYITSKYGFDEFDEQWGWGSLLYIEPGKGYKYTNSGTTDLILQFKASNQNLSLYETKEDALVKLQEAKGYTDTKVSEINATVEKLFSSTLLEFYCIKPVDIMLNNLLVSYPANSLVSLSLNTDDEFEIIPSENDTIISLTSYPGAIDTFYPWLEGVKVFSNILFNMNNEDLYTKWSQGQQGQYNVQYALYTNCIFWSDLAYISDVSKRTNYTLYSTSELPLCYSSIPENTFKSFYCAYGVTTDPNWSNPIYKNSFALATHATQVFSYYGLHSIGVFDMDASYFNITLPKDCRGLMYGAGNILNAGIFDAINVTNFGAKSGSWRDAFSGCYTLKNLRIKNLKVGINISWSPINQESIEYILSNAANTSAITISLSPYTYYSLTDANKALAAEKSITLELISTNLEEDNRLKILKSNGDGTKFLSDNGQYKEVYTKEEIDNIVGDINTILESIING